MQKIVKNANGSQGGGCGCGRSQPAPYTYTRRNARQIAPKENQKKIKLM